MYHRHLGSQLAEMEKAIEKMMEADFVHFALEDICHRLPAVLRKDGLHLTNSEMESSEVQYMHIHVHGYGAICTVLVHVHLYMYI